MWSAYMEASEYNSRCLERRRAGIPNTPTPRVLMNDDRSFFCDQCHSPSESTTYNLLIQVTGWCSLGISLSGLLSSYPTARPPHRSNNQHTLLVSSHHYPRQRARGYKLVAASNPKRPERVRAYSFLGIIKYPGQPTTTTAHTSFYRISFDSVVFRAFLSVVIRTIIVVVFISILACLSERTLRSD
ncbi:hypothetical protein EDB87DRAFT_1168757 [Lactarius vividus]|nr:hypothetical protein EDB87DRAFT_1168757 [Lactarius vividus]